MEVSSLDSATVTEALDGVHLAQVASGERASIQHFQIDPGAAVDPHNHHHEQVGWLASGTLVFDVDGEKLTVEAGDSYAIPGGEHHGVVNRGDEVAVGVEVFIPARPSPPWES
jgi:quercetin dioxygenase-like cupin family protein